MLKVNSGAPKNSKRNAEISTIVLRSSSELARCRNEEIEKTILKTIAAVSEIEQAELAGWFFLNESGDILEVLKPIYSSFRLPDFKGSLQDLPWCLSQLCSGEAVVLNTLADLPPEAETDRQSLEASGVRSIAFLPSGSASSGRTILTLVSKSMTVMWSDEAVAQYTLLENIFSSAYQRKLAQEESRTTVESFQKLFLGSTTALALLDHRGCFVSANRAFCDMLGYSEDEFEHMNFMDLLRSDNQIGIISPLQDISRHKTTNHHLLERRLTCRDLSIIETRIKVDFIEHHIPQQSISLISIEELTEHNLNENELSRRQAEIGILASQLIQSQENERKRLSRELHDDIGQRLSLAASEAALLANQYSESRSATLDRLDVLRDELDSLCSDVHEMSHNLHSYKLEHLGLKSALKDLCRRMSQTNFHVDFCAEELEEPVSKDVALCLYRVAQEALSNALRHSQTLVVAVTVTKLQNTFYMTIQDSGIGFDSATNSPGLGLLSMSERLKLLNGQFRVHSIPGRGTEIWVEVSDEQNARASN